MQTVQSNKFLQRVLLADAVVSGAVAVLQIAFVDLLAGLLNLPVQLLMGTGLFLVAYVVLLIALARASRLWSGLIWLVIVGNVAWAVGCAGLVMIAGLQPSPLGIAFLAVQAVTVLVFAALEYLGLARSEPFTRKGFA